MEAIARLVAAEATPAELKNNAAAASAGYAYGLAAAVFFASAGVAASAAMSRAIASIVFS